MLTFRKCLCLCLALPLLAPAAMAQKQDKPVLPVLLVRDTCDPPTEPVGKNVFAITCGTDEVLLMLTLKRQGKKEVIWEKRPITELKELTSGIRYQTINETGKASSDNKTTPMKKPADRQTAGETRP